MRKLLLLTALLGTLCLCSCGGEIANADSTPVDTVQTTPATPSQSDPNTTTQTDAPAPVTTTVGDPTTDDTPIAPQVTTTEKTPETTPPVTTTQVKPVTTTQPTTTTKKPVTTTKPITTTKKPTTTTAPVTTAPTPAKGTKISVRYTVNYSKGGYLTGATVQSVRYNESKTSTVTATANVGYKFVGWSDGSKDPVRSGEMPAEDTVYTAIFEVDALSFPVIHITTETGADVTSKEDYINGTIAISNCDEEYVLETMNMEIRGRGNFSWNTPKKSYRIKLEKKQNLLGQGDGKAKSWTLIANHCDQSLIRNYITLNFARKLDGIAFMSSATSVDLYLNGEYRGVYLLCEQNQVHEDRVNIPENPDSVQTGYLIEMSNYAAEHVFHAGGRAYETKNDLSADGNIYRQQQDFIAGIVQQCWDAVQRGDQAEIERYLDVRSVVDTYIVEELFKNKDDGWDSFYMFYDATVSGEVLHFGPIWDFDLSGGNADEGCDNPEGLWAGVSGQMQDNGWFCTLVRYGWFKAMVVERWNELKSEIDKIPGDILREAEAGFDAYSRNFDKWKIFGQRINLEPPQVTALRSYGEHYKYYSNWMKSRIAWLDGYFNDVSYAFDGKLTLKGSGSRYSPYLVSSEADFLNFTLCMANGQNFAGKYFRQTADLDMTSVQNYSGVGQNSTFAGVYDGSGYTVTASLSGYDECVFPYVTGTVMNLFTAGSINNSEHAAGICRSIRKGGKIVNCGSSMTLTGNYAGGIATSNEAGGGVIAGCAFVGSVNGRTSVSPINCYIDGRGGTYYGNYYIPGLNHNTAHLDPSTPKNETELAAAEMANALNGSLSRVATTAGVSVSDLCRWTTQNGKPALQNK